MSEKNPVIAWGTFICIVIGTVITVLAFLFGQPMFKPVQQNTGSDTKKEAEIHIPGVEKNDANQGDTDDVPDRFSNGSTFTAESPNVGGPTFPRKR